MRASLIFAVERHAAARSYPDGSVLLFERLIVLIEKGVRFVKLAIDVNANAGGEAFAVVGDEDVLPFAEFDGVDGFDAQAEVGETLGEVQADAAFHQKEAVALAFDVVFLMREDCAVGRIGLDPGGKGEGVEVIEFGGLTFVRAFAGFAEDKVAGGRPRAGMPLASFCNEPGLEVVPGFLS